MSKRKKKRAVVAVVIIIATGLALVSGYPLFGVGNKYTVVSAR